MSDNCRNPIRRITKEGEDYIRTECSKGKKLRGYFNRPLPFTYPPVPSKHMWNSQIYRIDNNQPVDTDEKWADYLIFLYNHYAQIYDLDPNILAAQAYIESHYITWNFAQSSSASGISQIIASTIYDLILQNHFGIGEKFTIDEQNKITNNFNLISKYVKGDEHNVNSFTYNKTTRGKYYRKQLHENVMNNPDIMIKAQFRYIKYISAKRANNLASSSLFGYNRGHGCAKDTYSSSIAYCKNRFGSTYIVEGINYVDRIYAVLGDKNGEMFTKAAKHKIHGKSFGYDKYFKQYFNKDDIYEAKFYESNAKYNDKKTNDLDFLYNPFGCVLK